MRVKVACINWGHPDAPKAMCYVLTEDDDMIADTYHDTWAEAMDRANRIGEHLARKAVAS